MDSKITEIDGAALESGGQILRIALTLSAIKRIPVRIINIRAGRKNPGLAEQHLRGVELVRDLSNGSAKGAVLGSGEVELWPGELEGGNHKACVRTAGSISLLLQVALPCSLFAKSNTYLRLQGGTNAEMAPQIDYMTEVFRPVLNKFGAGFDYDLVRRGYFPKGGGIVNVSIAPIAGNLKPVHLVDFGRVASIFGWSFVAGNLPIRLAHEIADGAISTLKSIMNEIQIERYKEDKSMAPHNCAGIILVARTSTDCILGGSALGKRNERPDETGRRAAEDLLKSLQVNACVDQYCQDQIIIFMALAKGPSKIRVGEITLHTKTAIFVAEQLTNAKFNVVPESASCCNIVECTGNGK